MKILAPAKLNLYLDITELRPNGYHTLETLFQTISLADELDVRKTRGAPGSIQLQVVAPGGSTVPSDPSNIVWKAAAAFFKAFGARGACHIKLTKRIPAQAGLGGGSSDAAATLKALSRLFLTPAERRAPRTQKTLHALAVRLGADVPFFLEGGLAKAWGIGEKMKRSARKARFWAVLVKPKEGCPTKDVYGWYDSDVFPGGPGKSVRKRRALTSNSNLNTIYQLIAQGRPVLAWNGLLYNAFEPVVFKRRSGIGRVKQNLIEAGALNACMSGSGSAVFGIVKSRAHGEEVLRALRKTLSGQIWVVRSI